jgi:hypothetical protein
MPGTPAARKLIARGARCREWPNLRFGVYGRGKTSNTLYIRSKEQSESILEAARNRDAADRSALTRQEKRCYSVLRTSPLAFARAALRAFFAAAA